MTEEEYQHFTAILEPNSKKIFEGYIEEMPEINTEGTKIKEILNTLRLKLENKLGIDQSKIQLSISIRVDLDY